MKKAILFSKYKGERHNYASIYELFRPLPFESVCFFVFMESWSRNFSPHSMNGGDTVKMVFLSKENFLH